MGGFAGEEAFGVRCRTSSNSYASGATQNSGNVLTDVPTTRVAQPPGGSSGFSLSWDQRPVTSGSTEHRRGPGPTLGGQDKDMAFGTRPRASSNTYANGCNQNCGNVITDRSSTRVNQAPGGRSTITL